MGAITDPPGHPGYGPEGAVFRVTNPSYAAYLETTAGKIIAEQKAQIDALAARCAHLEKYAVHGFWCNARILDPDDASKLAGKPCNCGFTVADGDQHG